MRIVNGQKKTKRESQKAGFGSLKFNTTETSLCKTGNFKELNSLATANINMGEKHNKK